MASAEKIWQSSADLWNKCAPLIPVVSSSWLFICPPEDREKHSSPPLTAEWTQNLAIWRGPGPLIMSGRQNNSRAGEEADRERRQADSRGEERRVIEANPESFDPQVVSRPPRLPLTICSPSSHLSLARPLALVQLLLLPPHNNRNLQK